MSALKPQIRQKGALRIRIIRSVGIFTILATAGLTIYFLTYEKDSIAISGGQSTTIDSDMDGIVDYLDEDDDNDGIPDTLECELKLKHFINGSFEEGPYPNTYGLYNHSQVSGWTSTVSGNKIEIWKDGFKGVSAPHGSYFCELNSTAKGAIYQTLAVTPGQILKYSFYHKGRAGQDRLRVYMGPSGNFNYQMEAKTNKNNWKYYSNSYTVPSNATSIYFYFYAYKTHNNHPSVGNLVDDIRISSYDLVDLDFDNDGIPNRLDLDSDDDGIYDVIEAGGDDPDRDGIVGNSTQADHDNDGVLNIVDPDHSNGVPLAVPDSDNDGNRDFLDHDADGDGIVDIVEARETADFTQLSGYDNDGDGIDDAFEASKAAVPLADTDFDGTPDYLDLDSDDDGISDAIEAYDNNVDGSMDVVFSFGDYDADGVDNTFDSDGTSNLNAGGSENQQAPLTFPKSDSNSAEPYWRHVGSDGGSFPIELIRFEGRIEKATVYLSWETATETNNDFFTIERSEDGSHYHEIASINGAGNSTNPVAYEYLDKDVPPGYLYYRLKQTDYDGQFEYFKPIMIEHSTKGVDFQRVFPNPYTESFTIEFNTNENTDIELKVYNQSGQIVLEELLDCYEGPNQFTIRDGSNLSPGTYFLTLENRTFKTKAVKLVKASK